MQVYKVFALVKLLENVCNKNTRFSIHAFETGFNLYALPVYDQGWSRLTSAVACHWL